MYTDHSHSEADDDRRNGVNGSYERARANEERTPSPDELQRIWDELALLQERQDALTRTPQPAPRIGGDTDESEDSGSGRSSAGKHGLRSRRLLIVLALAGLAILCVAGLRFWRYLQSYQWTDDAEIAGHLDPISTRINGTVVHVYVENTYHVRKGQRLVDLDPRDYQVALERARANLDEAQQSLLTARHEYQLAADQLAAGVAANIKAQLDVKRYRELLDSGVIAREMNDQIVSVGRVDAATVKSDRAAVAATTGMIGQAKGAVQVAQAALDQAKLNLSYTHIVAPDSGVVGDKTVQVGQRVQPGEQLLTVVPLNNIWVTADFRETQLRRMHHEQQVTIYVDATGRDYKGYVEGMPAASGELFSLLPPENATGNYVKVVQRLPVRIRFFPGQDPSHRLRPGMSVEPTVWLSSSGRASAGSK